MNDNAVILVSVTAAAGTQLAAQVRRDGASGTGTLRTLAGAFLLAAVLLLVAEFWASGARGLAVVVMVTSLVINGRDAFSLLASLVD